MSDIVQRLRTYEPMGHYPILDEAADEIERLTRDQLHWEHQNGLLEAEVERLNTALIRNSEWRDENIRVWAEVERLRAMVHDDAVMLGEQGREIERLNAVLREVQGWLSDGPGGPKRITALDVIRAALEGK